VASAASAKTDKLERFTSTEATSIPGLCLTASLKHGKQNALNSKKGREWVSISASEFVERVKNVTLGLAALGLRPGDRVALLSENRPEWSIADMAILSLGAITVADLHDSGGRSDRLHPG
jgi:long-chain acyl-CoA synthetase